MKQQYQPQKCIWQLKAHSLLWLMALLSVAAIGMYRELHEDLVARLDLTQSYSEQLHQPSLVAWELLWSTQKEFTAHAGLSIKKIKQLVKEQAEDPIEFTPLPKELSQILVIPYPVTNGHTYRLYDIMHFLRYIAIQRNDGKKPQEPFTYAEIPDDICAGLESYKELQDRQQQQSRAPGHSRSVISYLFYCLTSKP